MIGVVGAVPQYVRLVEGFCPIDEVNMVNLAPLDVSWVAVELVESLIVEIGGYHVVGVFFKTQVEVTRYDSVCVWLYHGLQVFLEFLKACV